MFCCLICLNMCRFSRAFLCVFYVRTQAHFSLPERSVPLYNHYLFNSYPVSWLLTACVQLGFFFLAQRRDAAKFSKQAAAADVRAAQVLSRDAADIRPAQVPSGDAADVRPAQVPSGDAASSRDADTADSPDSKS